MAKGIAKWYAPTRREMWLWVGTDRPMIAEGDEAEVRELLAKCGTTEDAILEAIKDRGTWGMRDE